MNDSGKTGKGTSGSKLFSIEIIAGVSLISFCTNSLYFGGSSSLINSSAVTSDGDIC